MSDTRTEILNIAERLIRTKGYHAFSYKDIANELGVKNAAIHYHFPSKAGLGRAVIERSVTNFNQLVLSITNLSFEEKLQAFINIYRRSQEQKCVCIMGALSPVYDSLPEEMQEMMQQMSILLHTWLTNLLEKGRLKGAFHFLGEPTVKASFIISSLLASLLLNKVMQRDFLKDICLSIQLDLKYD